MEKTINHPHQDSLYFLGDWVLEHSIEVFDDSSKISAGNWKFDEKSGLWGFNSSFSSTPDSITIKFQVYTYAARRVYSPPPLESLSADFFDSESDSVITMLNENSDSFSGSNLNQRGSLTRGIIVGSNQDFALESGLQFELNGQLTDDITINASLTDASIPFQPDGTTQNIREFDRVLIQLESDKFEANLGDVDMEISATNYAKLKRRIQGASVSVNSQYGTYNGAVSVVKGTFKSQYFQGRDGVQGPYRLTGINNEQFVIVLAGSERVFVNGQPVERGQENEYIIDYGLGEVHFTNNVLIKDETRILVEYEYIEQNFNRTLMAAEAEEALFDGRLKIGVSAVRQADGNDLLSQQTLSQENIEYLKSLGDDLDNATISGARLATDEDRYNVKYVLMDTTYNGESYQIYKNVPGSDEANYIVRFSNVGSGNGSYRRVSNAVNGLLYEWVGPGNGEYSSSRKLPAPEKQQMVSLNSSYSVYKNVELYGEVAASGFDKNRFSSLDNDDNNDVAYTSGIKATNLKTEAGVFTLNLERSYRGSNFTTFERVRDVEFERKWNVSLGESQKEIINQADIGFQFLQNSNIIVSAGTIDLSGFEGNRYSSRVRFEEPDLFTLNYQGEMIDTENNLISESGRWYRQNGEISKNLIFGITPFVRAEQEYRTQRDQSSDSLFASSLAFAEVGPGIRLSREKWTVETGLSFRKEKAVFENELTDEFSALERNIQIEFSPSSLFSSRNKLVMRSKNYSEDFNQNSDRNALLIQSVTNYGKSEGLFNGQLSYEVNTQRQSLLQETYFEVGPELGQYVWIDDNGDGIEQLNEFYPELSPNEGTYIRQFLPSDELLSVINLRSSWRNELKPLSALQESPLNELTFYSNISVKENSTTDNFRDVYLLNLSTFRNDSTTVTGSISQNYELDLFPSVFKSDLRVGWDGSESLNRRSSESLVNKNSRWYLNVSHRLNSDVRIFTDIEHAVSLTESDQLRNRNYDIRSVSLSPGIEYLVNRSYQTSLKVAYSDKSDRYPAEAVTADIFQIIQTNRAFLWRKIQANSRLEFRSTNVNGEPGAVATYELTQGTGAGHHLIWSLTANYKVSNLVRFSLEYNGRTVRARPDIHTAKITVSAAF